MTTPELLASRTRRPHRKTKTGCTECRRRRIKCSEEKPNCTACIRHSVQCVYQPATHAPPDTPRSVSCDEPSTTASSRINGTSEAACFQIDDLALLHHWTLSASQSIVSNPSVNHYWQAVFPQIGFYHPFVMDGILSIAALHLACLHPSERQRYVLDATRHHTRSLQGYMASIDRQSGDLAADRTDDEITALFACAILNILYVLATFGPLVCDGADEGPAADRKSRILGAEWIPVLRGVGAVLQLGYDRVRLGPLNGMLDLDHWNELNPDRDRVAGDEHFCNMRAIWAAQGGVDDAAIYDQAVDMLRKCWAHDNQFDKAGSMRAEPADDPLEKDLGYNRFWSSPIVWLHLVPDEYFVRLQQRQPPALVIFAYFGVLLHGCLEEFWFAQGWGRNIVHVVDELLGTYWSSWMEWPKQVVGLISK